MLGISAKDKAALIEEMMDPKKVVLTCGQHKYIYKGARKPNFKCPKCNFVSFMGLICNTPPAQRQEQFEMLEWTIHKMIEEVKAGRLTKDTLLKRPEVSVERGVN